MKTMAQTGSADERLLAALTNLMFVKVGWAPICEQLSWRRVQLMQARAFAGCGAVRLRGNDESEDAAGDRTDGRLGMSSSHAHRDA